MPIRIPVLLTLVALMAALLAVPSSASAARGMEIAIQDDPVFVHGFYYNRERALQQAQQLKVTRLRINASWASVVSNANSRTKPDTVTYNWGKYDDTVDAAARYGIRVQITLMGFAPAWATGNKRVGNDRPNPRLFGEFAAEAARHFRGRIDRYEIWNEPNWYTWLKPARTAPQQYRALYINAYNAIKGQNRSAKVWFGETSPYAVKGSSVPPLKFIRQVLCAKPNYKKGRCAGLKTDGFAHHAYGFGKSPTYKWKGADNVTLAVIGRLTSALGKLRKSRLLTTPRGGVPPVYITEYGWHSGGDRKLSASKQAAYLKKGFEIGLKARGVKQLLQYTFIKNPDKRYAFFDLSLILGNGKPLKAFNTLRSWVRKAGRKIAQPRGFTPPPRRASTVPGPPPGGGGSTDGGGNGGGGSGGGSGGTAPPPECAPAGLPGLVCT
jgi:hypothetical protein